MQNLYQLSVGDMSTKIKKHLEAQLKRIRFNKSKPSPKNDPIPPFTFCSEERLRIAAAYWLEASDHEKTYEDGIIMAEFTRYVLNNLHNIQFSDPRVSNSSGIY